MLVHRIPYPPNKGDKIRSFNLLKSLSVNYDIYLGCFYDDAFDQQYIASLNQWCKSFYCLRLSKWQSILTGLTGFLTNSPISVPYYYVSAMASWVNTTLKQQEIKNVLVYSSSMAQYIDNKCYSKLNRVIDFVDIDSDKWRQYAQKSVGVKRWFYHREARLLQKYEVNICQRFATSLFVSNDEANAFKQLLPTDDQKRVHSIANGVDIDFFDPDKPLPAPTLPESFIVFTGAMDYWANIDAVSWFCSNVWPKLKQHYPNLHFLIVGSNPNVDVCTLAQLPGVIVTGRVDDIRPYIKQALFAVAPMLIARGIQNKVLEAMAMNKIVVCSAMAMEGINALVSSSVIVANDAEEFYYSCLKLMQQLPANCHNRQWIISNFTWKQTLSDLEKYLTTDVLQ